MKSLLILLVIAYNSNSMAALNKKDPCFVSVENLVKGLANAYRVYDKKSARIGDVELIAADESRHYSVVLEHDSSVDSYSIKLSNDSAFKCTIEEIRPTQIGG